MAPADSIEVVDLTGDDDHAQERSRSATDPALAILKEPLAPYVSPHASRHFEPTTSTSPSKHEEENQILDHKTRCTGELVLSDEVSAILNGLELSSSSTQTSDKPAKPKDWSWCANKSYRQVKKIHAKKKQRLGEAVFKPYKPAGQQQAEQALPAANGTYHFSMVSAQKPGLPPSRHFDAVSSPFLDGAQTRSAHHKTEPTTDPSLPEAQTQSLPIAPRKRKHSPPSPSTKSAALGTPTKVVRQDGEAAIEKSRLKVLPIGTEEPTPKTSAKASRHISDSYSHAKTPESAKRSSQKTPKSSDNRSSNSSTPKFRQTLLSDYPSPSSKSLSPGTPSKAEVANGFNSQHGSAQPQDDSAKPRPASLTPLFSGKSLSKKCISGTPGQAVAPRSSLSSNSHSTQTHTTPAITPPVSTHIANAAQTMGQEIEIAQTGMKTPGGYLSSPRVDGWHHNGFADVKSLFQDVAFDAVEGRKRDFKDWFPEDEAGWGAVVIQVRSKADDLAIKRFGYFVSRLGIASETVPNANDVAFLQKKIDKIFVEVANHAINNAVGSQPSTSKPSITIDSVPTQPESTNFVNSEHLEDTAHDRTMNLAEEPGSRSKLITSGSGDFASAVGASGTSESVDNSIASDPVSDSITTSIRPSRVAAGNAASRITSQYAQGIQAFGSTQWCPECECRIIIDDWNTHLGSNKHRLNAGKSQDPSLIDFGPTKSGGRSESKSRGVKPRAGSQVSSRFSRRTSEAGELKWCDACECSISIKNLPNLATHLRSQKHQKNVHDKKQQRGSDQVNAEPREREPSAHEAASPPLAGPIQRPRAPPTRRDFETPKPVLLQLQKRPLTGTYQTSVAASLAIGDPRFDRPFQGSRQRGTINHVDRMKLRDRSSILRHVDFTPKEHQLAKEAIVQVEGEIDVKQTIDNLYSEPDSPFLRRDPRAVKSLIQSVGEPQSNPTFTVIESRVKDPTMRPFCRSGSLLRHRELGSSAAGRNVETNSELRIRVAENIQPWRSFMGASHDVVAVAWAPDSMFFAAGAVAHSNPEDLQYNRPCNLMLGDLRKNTMTELPDHRIDRPKPEAGPNANQDMYNACDPNVYKTVTTVKFRPQGDLMYSASEDQTVKIWDISKTTPMCTRTIKHDANVTGLDVSVANVGLFATASATIKNAIRVFRQAGGQESVAIFSSARAKMKPDWKMYPESLHWGVSNNTSHLLLAGFQEYGRDMNSAHEGHLCLWDINTGQDLKVTPASQAIHSATWHPTLPLFASGGAPSGLLTNRRRTRTVIRAWDARHTKRYAMEHECPADDMTDVTFHPLDPNIVTAGCTNSISYVWDFRWPEQPLHLLRHGKSVMPHGEKDTGVMMSLWGTGSPLYYTGSSDGSIRAWDIRRHPDDVMVRSVAQIGAGIQSGAFSPDGTHLLVGDATGGIHVLSSAPWEPRPTEASEYAEISKGTSFNIIRAPDGSGRITGEDENPGTEGIEAANHFLLTGELVLDHEYGPGKGPNYKWPYARHHREEKPGSDIARMKKEIYKQQPFSRTGEVRPEYATPIRTLVAARRELLDKGTEDYVDILNITPEGSRIISRATTDLPSMKATSLAESKKPSASAAMEALNMESSGRQRANMQTPTPPPSLNGQSSSLSPMEGLSPSQKESVTIVSYLSKPTDSLQPQMALAAANSPAPKQPTRPSGPRPMGSSKRFAVRSQKAADVIDNVIPEHEMMEENGWWPALGEDEVAKALKRPNLKG